MGKKWRVVREAPDRCAEHGKSVHRDAVSAGTAARDVEIKDGLEPGAMDTFWCEDSQGWHIGHRTIRERLERRWTS